jgi:prepilin-type N-terminal cleavage/methylation domain-containing protein
MMLGTNMNSKASADRCNLVNETGFSLIEVVISMGIFALGIMGVLTTQAASMRGNESAQELTQASAWMDNRVETLLSRPFDDPDLAAGSHQEVQENYVINWNVTDRDIDLDGNADLKDVQVLADVPSPGNRKTLRLFFMVSPDN